MVIFFASFGFAVIGKSFDCGPAVREHRKRSKWDRFADGITEDIITDLSHSKDLGVIARNSTEVYKDKPADIRQVGRDLGVKYVLEGSIQSIGERIRVTAQLVEAGSGSHIWSERYDRPVEDLFAVQNEVTQTIAATIAGSEGAVAEAERSTRCFPV